MLSGEEWAIVRSHPEVGANIVKEISPLRNLTPFILAHHERWDGRGFPGRLSGARIPVEGRLIARELIPVRLQPGEQVVGSACFEDLVVE